MQINPPELVEALLIGKEIIKKADERADIILNSLSTSNLEDFYKMPPIDGMTLLSIIAKMDEKSLHQSQKLLGERQSHIAKQKRPRRAHKDKPLVLEFYERWKKQPDCYSSKAEFIKDMLEKTDVTQSKTIESWIKEAELT